MDSALIMMSKDKLETVPKRDITIKRHQQYVYFLQNKAGSINTIFTEHWGEKTNACKLIFIVAFEAKVVHSCSFLLNFFSQV